MNNEQFSEPSEIKPSLEEVLHMGYEMSISAIRVGEAAITLLRTELTLAHLSARMLVFLTFILLCLAFGAWLSIIAALAVGLYELSGNLLTGIGGVAAIHLLGIILVIGLMRRRWYDLSLPRTRAMFTIRKETP